MDVDSILAQARSGAAPSDWNVWPLRRDYVRKAALKWGALSVVGFIVFALVLIVTFPSDFVGQDAAHQSIATVVIMLTGFLAFGSLALTLTEIRRLTGADHFWLIITPDTFVKASPQGYTDVPLEEIADITLRGVPTPAAFGRPTSGTQLQGAGMSATPSTMLSVQARLLGGAFTPRRGAASLAFRDRRANRVVTVATDDSFDSLAALDEILRTRVYLKEEQIRRKSSKPRKQ
jgi:hypothetical protein